MKIIQDICSKLIAKGGHKAYLVIFDEVQFETLAQHCYSKILDERGSNRQLITNPGTFTEAYYKDNIPDIAKVRELLKSELANQLYQRNLITESEYKKVWPTK